MQLELLANELLLELFEFLDGVYLFRAFYGLNSRFNNLLLLHCQNFHFNFRHIPKEDFDIICQQYLPSIFDRIISVQISDDVETPKLSERFLYYSLTLNRFMHLKSLKLCSINSLHTLINITDQCEYFLNLIHFNMIDCDIEEFSSDGVDLFNNIWKLPKLTHCNFAGTRGMERYLLKISIVSLSIKNVSTGDGNLRSLFNLLECTPNLRRLDTKFRKYNQYSQLETIVSSLTSLEISFSGNETALRDIFQRLPKLRYLTPETSSILWNGYKWEEILDTYFHQLKVFQFKIEHYPLRNEKDLDQLLDSFRTPFWLGQHQWFVGCQWNPYDAHIRVNLYTLPYAFSYAFYRNDWCFKSTCSDKKNYYSCDRVRHLTYSFERSLLGNFHLRFPNISELHIDFPYDPNSLSRFLSIDRLRSLHVPIKKASEYRHLQALLDRAPHLYLLHLKIDWELSKKLFQLTSSSVRRLDLLFYWKSPRLTATDCVNLISSPLGLQCEVLSVYVDNRINVLNLIQQMSNLRSVRFQCNDDKWCSPETNHELLCWLQHHLSSTCTFNECEQSPGHIEVWINRQMKDIVLSSKVQTKVALLSTSFKRFFKNLRRSN